MIDPKKVEIRFKRDVTKHKIEVVLDQGVHRHLRFNNGSIYDSFEIITYPGYLTIVGDRGSYTFQRTKDMFTFFRGRNINPGYWGEKLESYGTNFGYKEYDSDYAKESIKEYINDYYIENMKEELLILKTTAEDYLENKKEELEADMKGEEDPDEYNSLKEELNAIPSLEAYLEDDTEYSRQLEELEELEHEIEDLMGELDESEPYAISAIWEFSCGGISLHDFLIDCNFKTYTYGYLWICHAIVWAIEKYDQYKQDQKDHLRIYLEGISTADLFMEKRRDLYLEQLRR